MRTATIRQAVSIPEVPLTETALRRMVGRGECPGWYEGNRFYVNVDALVATLEKKSIGIDSCGIGKEKVDIPQYLNGDYVIVGVPNAFNGKTSYWISKKGCTISAYCFSAYTPEEVQYQLANGWPGYIDLFERNLNLLVGANKLDGRRQGVIPNERAY